MRRFAAGGSFILAAMTSLSANAAAVCAEPRNANVAGGARIVGVARQMLGGFFSAAGPSVFIQRHVAPESFAALGTRCVASARIGVQNTGLTVHRVTSSAPAQEGLLELCLAKVVGGNALFVTNLHRHCWALRTDVGQTVLREFAIGSTPRGQGGRAPVVFVCGCV